MPTIHCDMDDCRHIGNYEPICVARTIDYRDGECITYDPVRRLPRNWSPHCSKSGGKYKSDRITRVFK